MGKFDIEFFITTSETYFFILSFSKEACALSDFVNGINLGISRLCWTIKNVQKTELKYFIRNLDSRRLIILSEFLPY